jgi:hypothetical protein
MGLTFKRKNLPTINAGNPNSAGSFKRISSFLNNNENNENNENKGIMLDLTEIINNLVKFTAENTYGANATIQYISPVYKSSKFIDNIPIVQMNVNTFLLFEITLDYLWQATHNLLILTPYYYTCSKNGTLDTIFGSVDKNLFFTKSSLDKNNSIKICCTASEYIGNIYKNQGYYISKIPYEYIDSSTYSILFRIGTLGPKDNTIKINRYCKTSINTMSDITNNYYTSNKIIYTLPPVYPPISNNETSEVINQFNIVVNKVTELISNQVTYLTYPYLSNYTNPNISYGLTNFYESISLPTPINMQANNTGENYLMTNPIPVTDNTSTTYLFIIYLNQNSSGGGITSNIQIYNANTNNEINGGLINTAPNIPSFISQRFPYPINTLPPYGIYITSMTDLYSQTNGVDIIITERICYSKDNFNYTNYNLLTPSKIFVGDCSNINTFITQLQTSFPGITITTNSS